MAEIVGPAIELGKCIVEPIKRQFNYLCCFNSNIQSLRKEAKKLEDAKDGLQSRVNAAEDNVEVILPQVVSWLKSSDEIKVDINGIETEIPNVKRHFWNIKLRFLLSRKAKKTTKVMKELLGDRKSDDPISQPTPPAARGPIPIGETREFEARKKIEEDIMKALRGGEVNMLGICGMGGVGKTTMAKRIANRAMGEKLFDEVAIVVVSQEVNMSKIQLGISEYLGLKLEDESIPARAHKLRTRLEGTKKTLVVLDDVWEIPKLEELGIPSGVKECTILLTSRNRGVFNAMDVKNVFGLEILPEEEAWFFFREKVGTCVDGQDLVSIAKKVAKECKGLPLALVIVGRALKDEENKPIWQDALHQLEDSNLEGIPEFIKEVYNPLSLSYKSLDNEQKSVFLFCSSFPEDADISLEHLAWYFLGLRIFKRTKNLEATRKRVVSLVKQLKNHFLLLDGYDDYHVKMHDVVRDVAIVIASEEKLVDSNFSSIYGWHEHSYSDCTWISMFPQERIELPIVLKVPSLRLLLIHYSRKSEIQMHDQFFEAIKELDVLSLEYLSFTSFPKAMKLLENLQTLNLESCTDLESISIVGQLLNLQILRCHSCDSITELPAEIGRLIRLRLLDFSYCKSLKRIAPGVISSLVRLEELKMIGSFKGWEAEKNGKERRNASLNELQSLSNLTCLEIEIGDCTLAAEDIRLSSKIVKYEITFMGIHFRETFEKGMYLELLREISLGDWIHIFLRSTEYLYLKGDGSNSLNLAQVQEIKRFHFSRCSTVNKLVSTKSINWSFGVFPVLESLVLENLPNLEEICDGPIQAGSNSFNNLKKLEISDLPGLLYLWNSKNQNVSLSNLTSIDIEGCDKLRNVFPLKMAKDGLLQLKVLAIQKCSMMEEVFFSSNDGEESHITFPKLEFVSLVNLPNLTTFYKGIESIECPLLTQMWISYCPKLTSFVSSTAGNCLHLFCSQKVTFGSLQLLNIGGYENISNLWCHKIPPSMVRNLINLKKLSIRNCNEMVKVIGDDKENVCENSLIFPSLEKLSLKYLPNLVNFCGCALQLPSLTKLEIYDCPRMDSFTMGSLTTPKLSLVGFATCSGNNPSVAGHSDDSFHLFCNQKVTFGSLKKLKIFGYENISNLWCYQISPAGFFNKLEELKIRDCGRIRCLFSSSIAANLVNLKKLTIKSCNEMVKVIGDDEENVCENSQLMFPSLEELYLKSLPNLVNFCGWRFALQFPSLWRAKIYNCPWMESFTMGSLITPNLQSIKIDSQRKDVEDLNRDVQLYFRAEQQRNQESAQIEKEQEESNKEDGEHLKVETEEEEMKQAAEENCSSN